MSRENRLIIIVLGVGALLVAGYLFVQYALGNEYRLFALDAKTGNVEWSRPLEITSPLATSEGRVFAYSIVHLSKEDREYIQKTFGERNVDTFTVCAFDAASGRQLWEYPFDIDFEKIHVNNPPVAFENRVAFQIYSNHIGILDAERGSLQWHIENVYVDYMTQSFVFAGDRIVIYSIDEDDSGLSIMALDAQSGKLIWQADSKDLTYSDLHLHVTNIAVNDQWVYVTGHNKVEVFDIQSGNFQFSVETDAQQLQVTESALYIESGESLSAFDATTGALLWTFDIPDSGERTSRTDLHSIGQITYITNVIWGEDKKVVWVYALNESTGSELWRKQFKEVLDLDGISITSRSSAVTPEGFFFVIEVDYDEYKLLGLSAVDGTELWNFPLNIGGFSPVAEDDLVFIEDKVERWRNWFSFLFPVWRSR